MKNDLAGGLVNFHAFLMLYKVVQGCTTLYNTQKEICRFPDGLRMVAREHVEDSILFSLQRMHVGFDLVSAWAWAMHMHSVDCALQCTLSSFGECRDSCSQQCQHGYSTHTQGMGVSFLLWSLHLADCNSCQVVSSIGWHRVLPFLLWHVVGIT